MLKINKRCITQADSLHGQGVPDDPEVGHQQPAPVPGVPLGVLDAVQFVNKYFPRPFLGRQQ